MTSPTHVAALLSLLCGFFLSIIVFIFTAPLCDSIQERRLRASGLRDIESVLQRIEGSVDEIQKLAKKLKQLDDSEQLTRTQFSRHAALVSDSVDIYSLEWLPYVSHDRRKDWEAKLQTIYDEEIALRTVLNGTVVAIPEDVPSYPTVYLYPQHEVTKKTIGLQRSNLAAFDLASVTSQAYITVKSQFFENDAKRYAVVVSHGSADHGTGPASLLLAVLGETFAKDEIEFKQTWVCTHDITPYDYSPDADRNLKDRTLQIDFSSPTELKALKQIGGRLFAFVATESATAGFRPHWIRWGLFFLCNVLSWLVGMSIYQRESQSLQKRNRRLHKEIEKRKATQRHLQHTLDFRDHERELLAHEIHDGFLQDIIGAHMFIQAARASLESGEPMTDTKIELISDLLRQSIDEARRTIDYLKPKVVDEVGLIAAIESTIVDDLRRYGFETVFTFSQHFPRFPLLAERIIYRIVREALTNARQHSGTMTADLSLTISDDRLVVIVKDEGGGFDPDSSNAHDGFGISGIRHRTGVLSGTCRIDTSQKGTIIRVEVSTQFDLPEIPEEVRSFNTV